MEKLFDLNLVGLASFGVAGVSILMVFIVGLYVFKLSNDTPPWKVNLMKKYINTSLIVAVICAVSGIGNALINHKELKESKENVEISKVEIKKYVEENKNLQNVNNSIVKKIDSLKIEVEKEKNLNLYVKSNYIDLQSHYDSLEKSIIRFQRDITNKINNSTLNEKEKKTVINQIQIFKVKPLIEVKKDIEQKNIAQKKVKI